MILQWTSSVNNLCLPTNGLEYSAYDDTFSYEDLMKYHIWNLYSEMTSSGWVPVSSSYRSNSSYVNGQNWPSINNLCFPESMADSLTEQDLYLEGVNVYTPSEHCWVTLKKVFSVSEIYYITLDCRYPLPPHKKNTSIIIENSVDDAGQVTNKEIATDTELKLFIGTTSTQKSIGVSDPAGNPISVVWRNTQEINSLDGICFRDSLDTKFNMAAASIQYGQDYISRCVSFIDISILKASYTNDSEISRVTSNDGKDYISATTRVRPKRDRLDQNAWYICWGFDFLDSSEKSIQEKIKLEDYKFAFHKDGNGHFIYQIYKAGDSSFRSGFAFLPTQNKNPSDTISKISFCVNCDPSLKYSDKSINFNTLGTKVTLVNAASSDALKNAIASKLNTLSSTKETVNNFYNTSYRNYNFSDGKSCIRAGSGGRIGDYVKLPIYTPLKPKDSCIFAHSSSFISTPEITPSILMPASKTITTPKLFTGDTEANAIELKSANFTVENLKKRIKNQFMARIDYHNLKKTYPVYIQDNETSNKRAIITSQGAVYKLGIDSISPLGSLSKEELIKNPFYLSTAADGFSNLSTIFKSIYTTVQNSKSAKISIEQFKNLFNTGLFENNLKYIRFFIGSKPNINHILTTNTTFWDTTVLGGSTLLKEAKVTQAVVDDLKKLYPDPENQSLITTTTAVSYMAYTTQEMNTPVKSWVRKAPTANPSLENTTKCYIDVPIEDLYNLAGAVFVDEEGNVQTETVSGDFDAITPAAGTSAVNQYNGSNFFSVFKSSYAGYQQPLVSGIYCFSNNGIIPDVSFFGTVNKDSLSDSRILSGKDTTSAYPELPIFLFSTNEQPMIKGYVPDITWAPSNVNELSVVADSVGPKNYKKIYWGGCWFPWVSDSAPDI